MRNDEIDDVRIRKVVDELVVCELDDNDEVLQHIRFDVLDVLDICVDEVDDELEVFIIVLREIDEREVDSIDEMVELHIGVHIWLIDEREVDEVDIIIENDEIDEREVDNSCIIWGESQGVYFNLDEIDEMVE